MKKPIVKKLPSVAAILILAVCAGLLPQNSRAQDAAQTAAPATLPVDVAPTSPLAEVVKLAQAGVAENVILSYINNSGAAFNLTADQIIYLKDLGLPDDAVTAMMQRDQQLGATASAPTPPTATTDTTVAAPEQPAVVTQNYFYDTLSPYGSWVNVDGYGLCWQPTTVIYDSNWQPYCDHGHWVYTDDGWFWVSDYSWGACAFHYGRWFHDDRRGWCWWPDTAWAPSWVTWRYANDYCGWAPLPPRTIYREGVGIVYNGATVGANFDFGIGVNFFTFVPTRNFCDPHPDRFRVPHDRAPGIYQHTTVINNFNVNNHDRTVINGGIAPDRITTVTHTPVPRMTIRETGTSDRRGEHVTRDTIIVNRPQFKNDPAATLHQDAVPRPVSNRPNPTRPSTINDDRNNFTPAQHTAPQPQNNVTPQHNISPPQNNFTAPQHNWSTPQTQPVQTTPPATSHPATHNPPQDQNRNDNSDFSHRQTQTPVPTPAPAAPVQIQTPPANINSHQSDQLLPRQQVDQPDVPRTFTPKIDTRPTPDMSSQNRAVTPQPEQPSQRTFTPRQNDSPSRDKIPARQESPPVIVQPIAPPAQTTAPSAPSQKNSGRQDKDQNGP